MAFQDEVDKANAREARRRDIAEGTARGIAQAERRASRDAALHDLAQKSGCAGCIDSIFKGIMRIGCLILILSALFYAYGEFGRQGKLPDWAYPQTDSEVDDVQPESEESR